MKHIKQLLAVGLLFIGYSGYAQQTASLKSVLDNYIALKDALVKTDAAAAAEKSTVLLKSINAVESGSLQAEENTAWSKVLNDLKEDAEHIAGTREVAHQRDHFMTLSKNMYAVIKVSKPDTPVYYQFCPMANKGKGANWLSIENKVKNPYYGSQMLNCGKVVETIQ